MTQLIEDDLKSEGAYYAHYFNILRHLDRHEEFMLVPQLQLFWEGGPKKGPKKNVRPDILIMADTPVILGGMECKISPDVPAEFGSNFANACFQASDQVTSARAAKLRTPPGDIYWLVTVGYQVGIRKFHPLPPEQHNTRLHRPNDSGDWLLSDLANKIRRRAPSTDIEDLHLEDSRTERGIQLLEYYLSLMRGMYFFFIFLNCNNYLSSVTKPR